MWTPLICFIIHTLSNKRQGLVLIKRWENLHMVPYNQNSLVLYGMVALTQCIPVGPVNLLAFNGTTVLVLHLASKSLQLIWHIGIIPVIWVISIIPCLSYALGETPILAFFQTTYLCTNDVSKNRFLWSHRELDLYFFVVHKLHEYNKH